MRGRNECAETRFECQHSVQWMAIEFPDIYTSVFGEAVATAGSQEASIGKIQAVPDHDRQKDDERWLQHE